jgi:hypothetical protein
MKIRPLAAAACLVLCACADAAFADSGVHRHGVVPPRNPNAAIADDSFDFSEIVNFMFFVQFLDRRYGVSTDYEDPIEVNPLSIVYDTNDDPDAFDVALILE